MSELNLPPEFGFFVLGCLAAYWTVVGVEHLKRRRRERQRQQSLELCVDVSVKLLEAALKCDRPEFIPEHDWDKYQKWLSTGCWESRIRKSAARRFEGSCVDRDFVVFESPSGELYVPSIAVTLRYNIFY